MGRSVSITPSVFTIAQLLRPENADEHRKAQAMNSKSVPFLPNDFLLLAGCPTTGPQKSVVQSRMPRRHLSKKI
jgi:hypothetical protein